MMSQQIWKLNSGQLQASVYCCIQKKSIECPSHSWWRCTFISVSEGAQDVHPAFICKESLKLIDASKCCGGASVNKLPRPNQSLPKLLTRPQFIHSVPHCFVCICSWGRACGGGLLSPGKSCVGGLPLFAIPNTMTCYNMQTKYFLSGFRKWQNTASWGCVRVSSWLLTQPSE